MKRLISQPLSIHALLGHYLVETIEKENIKDVVFLTGDLHQTELTIKKRGITPFTT